MIPAKPTLVPLRPIAERCGVAGGTFRAPDQMPRSEFSMEMISLLLNSQGQARAVAIGNAVAVVMRRRL